MSSRSSRSKSKSITKLDAPHEGLVGVDSHVDRVHLPDPDAATRQRGHIDALAVATVGQKPELRPRPDEAVGLTEEDVDVLRLRVPVAPPDDFVWPIEAGAWRRKTQVAALEASAEVDVGRRLHVVRLGEARRQVAVHQRIRIRRTPELN